MQDYQKRAFDMATPGLPTDEKLGDFLTAQETNLNSANVAVVGGVDVTVGDEVTNAIVVSVQLKDLLGVALAGKRLIQWWLSDAAGGAATGTGPATSTAVTKGTAVNVYTAKISGAALTDANGELDLTLTETGAKTWYLNAACDGIVVSSDAITFA